MIPTDKPNPFLVLGLPTDAPNHDVTARGEELSHLAETEERRLLVSWAVAQVIRHPMTRLEHELFEVPGTDYDDAEWDRFARRHRRNPVDAATLAAAARVPTVEDFDLPILIDHLLDGLLTIPERAIAAALERPPGTDGLGPPPLEVRDVVL